MVNSLCSVGFHGGRCDARKRLRTRAPTYWPCHAYLRVTRGNGGWDLSY